MTMYIHHEDRFDPMTEVGKPWMERNRLQASENYRRIQQETKLPEYKDLNPEDKIEFTRAPRYYEVESATLTNPTQEALNESRMEYLKDERRLAEMSVLFRTYFRGGIGMNLDQIA